MINCILLLLLFFEQTEDYFDIQSIIDGLIVKTLFLF
nr:MAG TPA: hypothetical protein [Caudoviricetes sp.]